MLKTVVMLDIFVETDFFMILWWIESWNKQHLFEIDVFIITFNTFNSSLRNKSLSSYLLPYIYII